mmetsp:Transcript_4693/g.3205  ORF Transcript_4693/g.3205 Transcript_4693/m.3205 type:complete len:167 (-) Transcript_4693:2219-2719(-)
MISFGGNFWSSYRQTSNSIDDLLSKDDCTVENLLNDDDCLQEFKSHNEKLLNYFEHDKISELIDFITQMPEQEADHNHGHKFPFLSSEIFNCENNVILDKFFEAPQPKPKNEPTEEENQDDNDNLQGNDAQDSNDIANLDDIVQHDDAENDNAETAQENDATEDSN